MQFKHIAAIIASCVALGNAVAIPEAAPADQGLAAGIAAPNNLMARSLDQQVKHVRKLKARADQAEEAAMQARSEHVNAAKIVARDYFYGGEASKSEGIKLDVLDDLLNLDIGSNEDDSYFGGGGRNA